MANQQTMLQDSLSGFQREKRTENGLVIFNMECLASATGNMSILTRKITKVVDDSLAEQGATCLVQVGMGDDDQCIEDDFTAWRELVWLELDQLLLDNEAAVATPYTAAVLGYRVVVRDRTDTPLLDQSLSMQNGHTVFDAQRSIELHTIASDRSCIHLEFDISQTGLAYETGDHVGVYCENLIETVEEAEKLLGISPATFFSIHTDKEDEHHLVEAPCDLPFHHMHFKIGTDKIFRSSEFSQEVCFTCSCGTCF